MALFNNPKDLLFFSALFPQFMHPEGDTTQQLALLAVTWLVIAGAITFGYAVASQRLSTALQRFGSGNLLNRLTGGALVAVGAFLAVFERSSA
jgi:threonine/homoserine/homoserine lactone efflux protein